MSPGTSVKLSIVRKGEANTVSLTLGQSPGQRQANADTDQQATPNDGTPRLGLGDVGGAGNQGVAVTAVDPNGPAAAQGIKTGDVILDVAGKAVSKAEDVRQELASLHKDGKRSVLMAGEVRRCLRVRRRPAREGVISKRSLAKGRPPVMPRHSGMSPFPVGRGGGRAFARPHFCAPDQVGRAPLPC